MSKRDYYEVLGVARNVSKDDLKKAFRKMAMKYHPDRNQGDKTAEAKFKEVNEAYEVLQDDQKRAAYDRFGHGAFDTGGGGQGFQGGFGGAGMGGFADIFEEMFGQAMGGGRQSSANRSRATRGEDLRYDVSISLEDAFKGLDKNLSLRIHVTCAACKGTGAKPGTGPTTCAPCRGNGVLRTQQGFFTVERTCTNCQGTGQTFKDPCGTCHGQGRSLKEKHLRVSIPAGVDDGARIRLREEGEAGLNGGPAGDLYVFVSVNPHPLFKRQGSSLYVEATIPMATAILGGDIDVPSIDGGKSRVNIPAGTQHGRQIRLKSKGMSVLKRAERGDLYILMHIETPVNLTSRQKELIEEFQSLSQKANNNPHVQSFSKRLKDFWDHLTS
jgi:molecular chaperone DnaJ